MARSSHITGAELSPRPTTRFLRRPRCALLPLYFNGEYAKEHGYEGTVIDPLLVLCTVVGMSVEDLSEGGGPFLGVNDVEFPNPTYPGDTITAESTVIDRREFRLEASVRHRHLADRRQEPAR